MFFSIKQIKMMTLKVNIVILNTKAKKDLNAVKLDIQMELQIIILIIINSSK